METRNRLERECIKVPDGVSCLPDVIAQRINNEDAELRDRVEKLEELIVTTRAQLEKAFAVSCVTLWVFKKIAYYMLMLVIFFFQFKNNNTL